MDSNRKYHFYVLFLYLFLYLLYIYFYLYSKILLDDKSFNLFRNNDDRKEKAKNAARERRTQESDFFEVNFLWLKS